jgi:RimJ/RimL family protein N-acetyltransferase
MLRVRLVGWEADAQAMRAVAALVVHDEVLRKAIEELGGWLFKHTGDGVCAAFASPRSAVDAAVDLIGGVALLPLPPGRTDLEIGWQVAPTLWGHGYGAEAGHAVAHQAFTNVGVSEVFAVVRPGNHRGVATARRVGMEWVGETDKYYNLTLEIYRLSKADLDLPEPACAPAPGSH